MAGLRERKKRETAERIAAVAAELFAERGYEAVAMTEVARAADVSEQTVYNHFATKEDLVFDRTAALDAALAGAIAGRAPGVSAADAIAPVLRGLLDTVGASAPGAGSGGLPRLAADSATLRRAVLERTRGHAATIAAAIGSGDEAADAIAGWALAGLLQLVIEDLGGAQRDDEAPAATVARLRPQLEARVAALRALG